MVKQETDEGPYREVQARGRRYPAEAAEEYGEVDLSPHAVLVPSTEQPHAQWRYCTDEKGPHEVSVERARAEETVWTDDAPQDASIEMHPCDRTVKAVDCLWCADAGNISEHPVQNSNLSDAGDEGRDHLDGKEKFRRYLHVMSKFQVGRELDALGGADVAVGDEDHIGDGPAREHYTANELADEVQAAMLVRYSHHDTDRDE